MGEPFQPLRENENFLGIPVEEESETHEVIILPLPMEMTTTYRKGTCNGPAAILEASHQVELFDEELKTETFRRGIVTLEPMTWPDSDPEEAVGTIESAVFPLSQTGKKLIFLGGEHTLTVGTVRALRRSDPGISVLHLDAHADLRDSYEDSRYNHACVMARVLESCPGVSVGVRSMSAEEFNRIERESLPVFTIHSMKDQKDWIQRVLTRLTNRVYITLDLDVFDPSVIPGVGTPEPGGMGWDEVLNLLRTIFRTKQVTGLDVVELAPRSPNDRSAFITAKLVYRLIGYWTAG
jgi:agmatinase